MGQLSDFYSVYFMLVVLTLRQLSGSAHSLLASKEVAGFSEYARKAVFIRHVDCFRVDRSGTRWKLRVYGQLQGLPPFLHRNHK